MAESSAVDGHDSITPDTGTYLPQPYKIDGRFVIPWPGFKLPGAGAAMKWLATSRDESNIPPAKVFVTYCNHFLTVPD